MHMVFVVETDCMIVIDKGRLCESREIFSGHKIIAHSVNRGFYVNLWQKQAFLWYVLFLDLFCLDYLVVV